MKKKSMPFLLFAVIFLFTGCGNTLTDSSASNNTGSYDSDWNSADVEYEAEAPMQEENEDVSASIGASPSMTGDQTDLSIDREMLVYTCDISIDTLNFDESVAAFKEALAAADGFVESESYDDGYYGSSYVVEEEDKDRTYRATVRVPSRLYEDFLAGAEELGDVRSKSAYVQNVSQEYSDLGTALEIYEAKEERYINLLSTITDDEYAVEIEKELTELQIQIAQIKTRMNQIKTDVAYSYVNVTIHAVREYVKAPAKTDTFGQRLVNQLHNTWSGFLWFLETALFVLIGAFPYLAIMAVIVFVIVKIAGKNQKQRIARMQQNQNMRQNTAGPGGTMAQGTKTPEESANKKQ